MKTTCSGLTSSGDPCRTGPSFMRRDGSVWCHLHAERSACRLMTKAERRRRRTQVGSTVRPAPGQGDLW